MWSVYADWNMTPAEFAELGIEMGVRGEALATPEDADYT